MTSEQRYKLVFNGQILEGFEAKAVQKSLATALKLGEAQLKTLFSGRLITVRKGLDPARAEKFRAVFERAGARVHVHLDAGDDAAAAPVVRDAVPPRAQGKLQAVGEVAPAAAKATVGGSAKPAAKHDPVKAAAKPAAKSDATRVSVKPAAKSDAASATAKRAAKSDAASATAKPAAKGNDKGRPVAGGEGELECPRCAYRQPVSEQCVHCRMDLRRHLRKLERRAKLRERRRQAGVG